MINKVILIGNLGADPEVKYTQSGVPVANFTVATNERWKGQDGQMQEHTEWHRIVAWRDLAERCKEYYHKGMKVYVEGKLQTRKWQDQNGNDRWTTEIQAWTMRSLTPRGESGGSGAYDPGPERPSGGGYGGGSSGGGYDDSFSSGGQSGSTGGTGSDVPF